MGVTAKWAQEYRREIGDGTYGKPYVIHVPAGYLERIILLCIMKLDYYYCYYYYVLEYDYNIIIGIHC